MKPFPDEMQVEMISALGQSLGRMCMPKKMRAGLINVYLNSGAVRSTYLYIDKVEITDGKNHNPFKGAK